MKITELKAALREGALEKYSSLYTDIQSETERFIAALDSFAATFGEDKDVSIFSVPGRSEIIGNHTDHNAGKVMAGAITRDIIAVAAKSNSGMIRFKSEGFSEDFVKLSGVSNPSYYKHFTSRSLVAGMAGGFMKRGFSVGGADIYMTTKVLKGSGLSSSAAFEVMIGNVLNHFYNGGKIDNKEIAKVAQYSENVYFGKPCGLMDQMACAVGGFVYIDFENFMNSKKKEELDKIIEEETLNQEETYINEFHILEQNQHDGKTFRAMVQEIFKAGQPNKDFTGRIWQENYNAQKIFKSMGALPVKEKYHLKYEKLKEWLESPKQNK